MIRLVEGLGREASLPFMDKLSPNFMGDYGGVLGVHLAAARAAVASASA